GRARGAGLGRPGPAPARHPRPGGGPRRLVPQPLAQRADWRLADPLPAVDGHAPHPPAPADALPAPQRPGAPPGGPDRPPSAGLAAAVDAALARVGVHQVELAAGDARLRAGPGQPVLRPGPTALEGRAADRHCVRPFHLRLTALPLFLPARAG